MQTKIINAAFLSWGGYSENREQCIGIGNDQSLPLAVSKMFHNTKHQETIELRLNLRAHPSTYYYIYLNELDLRHQHELMLKTDVDSYRWKY